MTDSMVEPFTGSACRINGSLLIVRGSARFSLGRPQQTPIEAEDEGEAIPTTPTQSRIPGHFTQNVTIGADLFRRADRQRIGVQFNVENLTNDVYRVSQESIFSPGEYFHPRFFSA